MSRSRDLRRASNQKQVHISQLSAVQDTGSQLRSSCNISSYLDLASIEEVDEG